MTANPELKDAGYLWGKDSYETGDTLMARIQRFPGSLYRAGRRKLSLVSCIMTNRGSAAGRSGLGAVMGSKKLKAVVARGTKEVQIVDKVTAQKYILEYIKTFKIVQPHGMTRFQKSQTYGTGFSTYSSPIVGDSPVKNWGGVGVVDFPDIRRYPPRRLFGPV